MARLALFVSLLLMTLQSHAQKHYTFTVQNVSSYPEAKPVISLLRNTFNKETPRLFFPVFEAAAHRFTADSDLQLSEQKLRDVLSAQGYTLTYFKSEEIIKPENETEKQ